MAAPVWQAAQSGNTNGSGALTVSSGVLTGFQVGDLAVAAVALNATQNADQMSGDAQDQAGSTATHGGWTAVRATQWNDQAQVKACYCVITGAGDLGATFDFNGGLQLVGCAAIVRITGQHATPILASTNGASGLASNSPSSGTMTPETDALVIGVGAWEGKKTGTPTSSPAFTERVEEFDSGSDNANKITLYVDSYVAPNATAVASAPTISSSTDWSQMVFAVKAAAGGGGGSTTERHSTHRGIARGQARGIA